MRSALRRLGVEVIGLISGSLNVGIPAAAPRSMRKVRWFASKAGAVML